MPTEKRTVIFVQTLVYVHFGMPAGSFSVIRAEENQVWILGNRTLYANLRKQQRLEGSN